MTVVVVCLRRINEYINSWFGLLGVWTNRCMQNIMVLRKTE